MNKVPMTINGANMLKEELHKLKTVERPSVISAIAEAREHGDLKENAEYHAAKEKQSFIEGRIRQIEGKLSDSHIIDVSKINNVDSKVIFGCTVALINVNTDETIKYQIVGEDEADVKEGKISLLSPIARALIGKFEGDVVDVEIPNGVATYEIDQVEYI